MTSIVLARPELRSRAVLGVEWVLLGPEPHLATCQRCQGTVAMPEMGITLDAFLKYMRGALARHAACAARTEDSGLRTEEPGERGTVHDIGVRRVSDREWSVHCTCGWLGAAVDHVEANGLVRRHESEVSGFGREQGAGSREQASGGRWKPVAGERDG